MAGDACHTLMMNVTQNSHPSGCWMPHVDTQDAQTSHDHDPPAHRAPNSRAPPNGITGAAAGGGGACPQTRHQARQRAVPYSP